MATSKRKPTKSKKRATSPAKKTRKPATTSAAGPPDNSNSDTDTGKVNATTSSAGQSASDKPVSFENTQGTQDTQNTELHRYLRGSHKPLGGQTVKRILLIDLSERERKERDRMSARVSDLKARKNMESHSGGLSNTQEKELARLQKALNSDLPVDQFYQAVASGVDRVPWDILSDETNPDTSEFVLKHGLFGSQRTFHEITLREKEAEIAAVCGLLQDDNLVDPKMHNFTSRIVEAQGEYVQNKVLFDKVFERFSQRFLTSLKSQIKRGMVDIGIIGCINPGEFDRSNPEDPVKKGIAQRIGEDGEVLPHPENAFTPDLDHQVYALSCKTLAAMVRRLVSFNVQPNDPWIDNRIESAFNAITGVVDGAPPSVIEIDLPDLEEDVDIEIQKENLHAVQALYFSWQLEEMRLFQVVERIVELFRNGLLVLGRGDVGDYLFNYYKKSSERITELERRDLYLRVFGAPGGNPDSIPNRDFNELWLRFVSAVSNFGRQLSVDNMLRSKIPVSVSQEQVRKAGRDLGANMSRNGYGIAYFAATELQKTIVEFRDVLQNPELRGQFGARDMWQVIDQVNVSYLGGARNTHRYRTQSRAGAVIIRWIANNISRLSNIGGPVLDNQQIVNPVLQASAGSSNPTVNPTDYDLVNACDQWLAVGGVQEENIDQYSQPIESPVMTSRPIDIPTAARDVLSNLGISLPSM